MKIVKPKEILTFWFCKENEDKWFLKDSVFDKKIRDNFLSTYKAIRKGKVDSWEETQDSFLALVILLDQFPRNMFRNTPQAFETDDLALKVSKEAISKSIDKEMPTVKKKFLYMPFMHSESLIIQQEGLTLFEFLDDPMTLEYAVRHADIIKRFGRFPHRNEILGRKSSSEEEAFLKEPGSSF